MVYARGERERWSQVGYSAEMIEMREARERGTEREREREIERWNQSTSKRKSGKRSVGFGKRRVGAEEKKKEITAERARSTGMGRAGRGGNYTTGREDNDAMTIR